MRDQPEALVATPSSAPTPSGRPEWARFGGARLSASGNSRRATEKAERAAQKVLALRMRGLGSFFLSTDQTTGQAREAAVER
jgi:hypothetical protein